MIGLLQRVSVASVVVDGATVGAIERGLLVLVGVERGDGDPQADRLVERLLGYRVFPDAQGRMNLSVREVGGGVLLVPQFTLAADTTRGMRPSFTSAAPPELGRRLFGELVRAVRERCEAADETGTVPKGQSPVQTGSFGADMKVALVNDGPVTFLLRVKGEG